MIFRPIVARLEPMLEFLRSEAAGGAMLILSAVAALGWANSPYGPAYEALLHWRPPVPGANLPLHIWINDGLMALFFLLVGLELRREIAQGQLASVDRLAAPGFAALGGMLAPAAIFAAFNWSNPEAMRGWAVPIATDIAFALAVASALGPRAPVALKVFLTALAIIDDLGAILVIALFYSHQIDLRFLGLAALVLLCLAGLNHFGERRVSRYCIGGVVLWALVYRSGIHATLAGVALAFVVPMRARPDEAEAPALRLEHALHPYVSYLVLPVFGLTNAGLNLAGLPHAAWRDPLAIGAALGLVAGKQIGVFGGVMAAARLGLARLPEGVGAVQLWGASALCGIGFTMSLFIADLAFRAGPRNDVVTLAVFVGSVTSAVLGLLILGLARPPLKRARG